MKLHSLLLTLDANVFVAGFRTDEPAKEKCSRILADVSEKFVLAEPSIVYQEVCGAIARKIDLNAAHEARRQLDLMIDPNLLTTCDRRTCVSAYALCSAYQIYSIDALYLHAAIANQAVLVSLDKEDFIEKLKNKKLPIEAYTVDDYPYW
jgi:predicted nucleic acid-binding protein